VLLIELLSWYVLPWRVKQTKCMLTVLSLPLEFVRCRISFQSNCRAGTLYRGESNSRALVVELYFVDRTVELVCCTMASQTVELYVVYVICSVTLSCILIELSNLCYIYMSHIFFRHAMQYMWYTLSDILLFEYFIQHYVYGCTFSVVSVLLFFLIYCLWCLTFFIFQTSQYVCGVHCI